jgi:hypothetical protein
MSDTYQTPILRRLRRYLVPAAIMANDLEKLLSSLRSVPVSGKIELRMAMGIKYVQLVAFHVAIVSTRPAVLH